LFFHFYQGSQLGKQNPEKDEAKSQGVNQFETSIVGRLVKRDQGWKTEFFGKCYL
jgi:hypothetical protein